MPKELQRDCSTSYPSEDELCQIRWFLIRLYAITLVLSIPASVIIAILMHNPLPGLIPAPLLLCLRHPPGYLWLSSVGMGTHHRLA